MQFLHPEILWALSALSIPILVHLFNFRKFKKVQFSNVAFLKEIKQETKNKSKLKHLLILLARMLALTAIIFAFAQPYVPIDNASAKSGQRAISIYIDNSFSMEDQVGGGSLLEIAKNKAIEIVNAFQPTDQFQLLTNDFEGRHQRLVSQEDMINLIQEVQVSPQVKKVSEVFSRQRDLLNSSSFDLKTAFILNDFQKTTTDVAEIPNDSTIQLRFVPTLPENTSNAFIDSLWFTTPVVQLNQPAILMVKINNESNDDIENLPIKLSINGQQKSVASANINANNSAEVALNFSNTEAGIKDADVMIDDHPIVFDDHFYFSYAIASSIRVLELHGNDADVTPFQAIFSDDPFFEWKSLPENTIDFNSFATTNFIIINQIATLPTGLTTELQKFISNGGSVLIIPHKNADISTYNTLTNALGAGNYESKVEGKGNLLKVSSVNYQHELYRTAFDENQGNVELPAAVNYFPITTSQRSSTEYLMTLQNGSPYLSVTRYESGRLYLAAVALSPDESNFTNHAFFPTSLIRMAEFSQPTNQLYYTIGKGENISLRNVIPQGEQTFRLQRYGSEEAFIPEHRSNGNLTELFVGTELATAGNYNLTLGDTLLAGVSFNYDRQESNVAKTTMDEIELVSEEKGWNNISFVENDIESIGAIANELEEGKKYWWGMIVMALIFLAIEILLIKFWK